MQIPAFKTYNGKDIPNIIASDESLTLERESLERIMNIVANGNDFLVFYGKSVVDFDLINPEKFIEAIKVLISERGGIVGARRSEIEISNWNQLKNMVHLIDFEIEKLKKDHPGLTALERKELFDEAKQRFRPESFNVADTERASIAAKRYRSPLTISLDLLKSLEIAGPGALISVSDPRYAHNVYFRGGDEKSKYDQPVAIPKEIWQSHEYATLSAKADNDGLKFFESLNFVKRHIVHPSINEMDVEEDSENYLGKKNRRMNTTFPTMDVDSDSEDDLDSLISNKNVPKGRFTNMNIGAKAEFEDPKGGWSKKKLSNPASRKKADVRRPFSQAARYNRGYNLIVSDAFVERWKNANKINNSLVRASVQVMLLSQSTEDQWLRMLDNNILVPINIILWRMSIQHNMASAILMKGGLDTGANYWNTLLPDIGKGIDVVNKTAFVHVTFVSKPVVHSPEHIHLLESIRSECYKGGSNTEFLRDVNDRGDDTIGRRSLIATAENMTAPPPDWLMSINGKPQLSVWKNHLDGTLRETYSTAEYYSRLWKFDNQRSVMGTDTYISKEPRTTCHAFQGTQAAWSRTGEPGYNYWTKGKGHRKDGVYPGAAEIWNGAFKPLEAYDYNSANLQ